MTRRIFSLRLAAVLFCLAMVPGRMAFGNGPKDSTVLVIRHAEKPDDGAGLTPAGEARAQAYVAYFKSFRLHNEPVKLDAIFAAADSRNSRRPRMTVEPLARALGLAVNTNHADKDYVSLVDELRMHYEGKNILLCWHHGALPDLFAALGANPGALLPGGRWPADEYDWIVALRFDHDGRLKSAERLDEHLTGSHPS